MSDNKMPEPPKCSRKACRTNLGDSFYRIQNDVGGRLRDYCMDCGFKIIIECAQFTDTRPLEYEIITPVKSSETKE